MKNNMQSLEYKELIEHIRLRPGMYLGRLGNGNASDDGIKSGDLDGTGFYAIRDAFL